jgi:dGTPase
MLSAQVYDVIAATRQALDASDCLTADEARLAGPLVQFSEEMRERSAVLKRFLLKNLYRHPQVMQTTGQAKQVVRELFSGYMSDPLQMAAGFSDRAAQSGGHPATVARAVADYIAGMTDRFAAREHERLTGQRLLA